MTTWGIGSWTESNKYAQHTRVRPPLLLPGYSFEYLTYKENML